MGTQLYEAKVRPFKDDLVILKFYWKGSENAQPAHNQPLQQFEKLVDFGTWEYDFG